MRNTLRLTRTPRSRVRDIIDHPSFLAERLRNEDMISSFTGEPGQPTTSDMSWPPIASAFWGAEK
jgi:hypothetical protein